MITGQPRKPVGDDYSKLELIRELDTLHKRINDVFKVGPIELDRTTTPVGTTGNRTIDKINGTVNFAAGATTIVVTNKYVNENSHIFCSILKNDATALVKNVVPAEGSFTIRLNAAATAETPVGFLVFT